MKSCNHTIRFRMRVFAALLVIPAVAVIVRLVHLQITRGEELRAKAASKYTGSRKTVGKRGEIYDRNGRLLVGNMPCDSKKYWATFAVTAAASMLLAILIGGLM